MRNNEGAENPRRRESRLRRASVRQGTCSLPNQGTGLPPPAPPLIFIDIQPNRSPSITSTVRQPVTVLREATRTRCRRRPSARGWANTGTNSRGSIPLRLSVSFPLIAVKLRGEGEKIGRNQVQAIHHGHVFTRGFIADARLRALSSKTSAAIAAQSACIARSSICPRALCRGGALTNSRLRAGQPSRSVPPPGLPPAAEVIASTKAAAYILSGSVLGTHSWAS